MAKEAKLWLCIGKDTSMKKYQWIPTEAAVCPGSSPLLCGMEPLGADGTASGPTALSIGGPEVNHKHFPAVITRGTPFPERYPTAWEKEKHLQALVAIYS